METADSNLETFRQEAVELLAKIEAVILVIEEEPQDSDAINSLFRAVHTLKGSSGMFGLVNIAEFSHGLESVLDKVRNNKLAVSKELIDLVLAYHDQVALMLGPTDGKRPDADRIKDITRRLSALCPLPDKMPERANAKVILSPPPIEALASYRIRFTPEPCLFAMGVNPALLLDELRALGECTVVAKCDDVPPLGDSDPEACFLSWEIVLTTSAGRDAIRDVFVFVEDVSKITIDDVSLGGIAGIPFDAMNASPKAGVEPQVVPAAIHCSGADSPRAESTQHEQRTAKQPLPSQSDSVRVPSEKLDALINLLGELVINQARLTQIARDMGDMTLAAPVEEADRLTNELRDVVLNIRMMPIGTTFSRFKRLVRDLSSELGKQIDLVTEGAETELDKTVIDRMGDPLVHLIRNSIDHGIERPEERMMCGKPTHGTIKLTAAHVGANVVISIIDDGKGLDRTRILAKALEKGLIPADVELTDKEVYDLIFLPGFSTATNVTDVSGRGVGMDVVRREIDSLRGTITVRSQPNCMTQIDLCLPLTLAIIEGLLVRISDETFVIPLSSIEGCLELTADCYATSPERNLINVRGVSVPLIRLRGLFELSGTRPLLEQVVVVNVGDTRVGLVVDEVIGNHQTVIKSLGKVYQKADCVSGATILGDGMVAMILDLAAIVRNAKRDEDDSIARFTKGRRMVEAC
ncbi:MAG: chemotaxis protein CheA [Rhizomicrobium sp.]|nr:chemotaxis protein CheA [Rhizomicrobium sp.]